MQTMWDARTNAGSTGTVEERIKIRTGVALLKIDEDVKFWTRSTGVGYQVEGYRGFGNQIGSCKGLIIKAKLGSTYVCPRKLSGRKVFYKFYFDVDNTGCYRPYLYLAAKNTDVSYIGTRCVIIAKNGTFLAPDKTMKQRLDNPWPPIEDSSPLTIGEQLQAHYDKQVYA